MDRAQLRNLVPVSAKRHYWACKNMSGLVPALREYFREPVTLERAKDEIKRALERREENFLGLAKAHIFNRPSSPYRKLLRAVQCEFADLEDQVRRRGIEPTLERLAGEGVYLTSEEFKGKQPVVRRGVSFAVTPADFICDGASAGFSSQSSGTKNPPVHSFVTLDWLHARAYAMSVFFSAHNLFSYSHGTYDSILPGAGGINNILTFSKIGQPVERWFARWVPNARYGYHYLTTQLIVLAGKMYGPGLPTPEFENTTDVQRIIRWILEKRRAGKFCCITTSGSNAARIARTALESGRTLEGTKFFCAGEPMTDTKREIIERVGASVTVRFTYGGSVTIGLGCGNPIYTDEVHVNQDLLALISHQRFIAGNTAVRPLLCTTLSPAASRFLFNVESGDYATFIDRDCGCALEQVGFKSHLYHIRSFEKFTSEGMNYYYGDLFETFEKTFPSEFGGGAGDYQLVEAEDAGGQTTVTLRVHPRIGEMDDRALLKRLHQELSKQSWTHDFQARVWQNAGILRVSREIPYESARGKILPLHIDRETH